MSTLKAYGKKVYQHILTEAFKYQYAEVCDLLNEDGSIDPIHQHRVDLAANIMQESIFTPIMNKPLKDIHDTITKDAGYQLNEMAKLSLVVAKEMETWIINEKADIPEEVELADHEKEMITAIFDMSKDAEDIEKIQDGIINALEAEDKAAQEVKEITDLAKQNSNSEKTEVEIVNECLVEGPRSLMHGIMTNVMQEILVESAASITEKNIAPGKFLQDNKATIQDNSKAIYAIFECIQGFGWKSFEKREVAKLANSFYNAKPDKE